ncbi:hypothetical protein MBLNU459_g4426t1 [Dothideomycetes sp. NU459]
MSASVKDAQSLPSSQHDGRSVQKSNVPTGNYKGFVAGVFSGIAKLSVGHPFDTIKVRLQTSDHSQFKGPLDCLMQTLRKEGPQGLYKGATPPLIGWMFMDSLMLGSLTFYRRMLNDKFFQPMYLARGAQAQGADSKLPTIGHAMAGVMAGATVSFIAAPVEHIKARLQVQYSADKTKRLYSGPIDCSQKIYKQHGMRGLYHGLGATLIFRTFFFFWWGSYDLFTRALGQHTSLSTPAINFWAGGLSAQVFWITSYPSDVLHPLPTQPPPTPLPPPPPTDNMGGGISKMMAKVFGSKEMRLLMLGLDAAGKTTILYKLKLDQDVTTIPTVGFNVETVTYKNTKFNVWDVGGQDKIRPLWRHYFSGTQGLIFVIDSNDKDRMDEARTELTRIIQDREMKDALLLVFANKQDINGGMSISPVFACRLLTSDPAMKPKEVSDALNLNVIAKNHVWKVEPSCATTGEGIFEGLAWLSSHVKSPA